MNITTPTKLISGSVFPELARETAREMKFELTPVDTKKFANDETYVRIGDSVRGDKVFIIQSMASRGRQSLNDSFVETLLLVDAAKRASAAEITVVMPYMAYGRQDRKAKGREPISAATVINALQGAGADRLVSIDMHSAQTQAVFDGPFDHLTAVPNLIEALKKEIAGDVTDDVVVVAPDAGRVKEAEEYAEALGTTALHIPKSRSDEGVKHRHGIEMLDNKVAIITDDMIDTAGTLVSAVSVVKAAGARRIIVAATHGILSDPALERLDKAPIDKIIVTNSIENSNAQTALGDRLRIVSISRLLADGITRIASGDSVSEMFGGKNYK